MNRLYVPAHSFRILSFVLQLFSESSIGFGCLAEAVRYSMSGDKDFFGIDLSHLIVGWG